MTEQLIEKAARQILSARKTRTLYVREEDQPIWDRAKEIIGESLSAYLTNHLRTVISSHEAGAAGSERIILSFREDGIPRTKVFYGRWLISPEKPFGYGSFPDGNPDFFCAVAITPKNNIVIFTFDVAYDSGKFGSGDLRIYDSFEKANSDHRTPPGLIADAMEALGVEVEVLDI